MHQDQRGFISSQAKEPSTNGKQHPKSVDIEKNHQDSKEVCISSMDVGDL